MEKDLKFSRKIYDSYNKVKPKFKSKKGISKKIIEKISKDKGEPDWMLKKRLKSFEIFKKLKLPKWGPNLDDLNLDEITYYVDPNAKQSKTWDDVPKEIKKTFEKLKIPQIEREALAGVGAQFDSGVVYHNLKKDLEDKGVIFENMDDAVRKYPDMVKKYFMSNCVPLYDHKFTALHGAVWSGGTFIYVPKNTKVELPLQAYFRMNEPGSGQFEHTLIIVDENSELSYIEGCSAPKFNENNLHAGCVEIFVLKNSKVEYSSIENWSKNTYNLNTKRSIVYGGGEIKWLNGNMGSSKTMLYPCSVLLGNRSSSISYGIAFASKNQNQDTGSKVIHIGENTSSLIISKSISKGGGISSYRGLVKINKNSKNSISQVECDALMLDKKSFSNTYPEISNQNFSSEVIHEAKVGRVGEEELFYLSSKGLDENKSKQLIAKGFSSEVVKKLPFEYANELNRLIELEIENSIG